MPPDHSALLAHIVSQTRQNVEFLIAQNEISRDAGQRILSQLPAASDVTVQELSDQTRRMTIPSPAPQPSIQYDPPPTPPSGPPVRRTPQPQPTLQQAKALWSYNENGSVGTPPLSHRLSADGCPPKEPNDLSFRVGDIIEVVAETNADWWTGRLNGKQGLFPSNYVEKVSPSLSPPSYPPPIEGRGPSPAASPVPYNSGPPAPYQPYNAPPQGYQSQPPQPYNQYMGSPSQPPPPQQVVVQQAPPAQPAQPSRFGGLKQVVRV